MIYFRDKTYFNDTRFNFYKDDFTMQLLLVLFCITKQLLNLSIDIIRSCKF